MCNEEKKAKEWEDYIEKKKLNINEIKINRDFTSVEINWDWYRLELQ